MFYCHIIGMTNIVETEADMFSKEATIHAID